jgi:hypothetical protein
MAAIQLNGAKHFVAHPVEIRNVLEQPVGGAGHCCDASGCSVAQVPVIVVRQTPATHAAPSGHALPVPHWNWQSPIAGP